MAWTFLLCIWIKMIKSSIGRYISANEAAGRFLSLQVHKMDNVIRVFSLRLLYLIIYNYIRIQYQKWHC